MKSQIVIFEGNMKDGLFSKNPKFYPKEYTEKDIYESYKKDRVKLGEKYGFSGLKMFHPKQKKEDNDLYPDNKMIVLNELYMKKDDYFKEILEADIVVLSNKYHNIAVAHNMADCPILIAEDRRKGVTALAHCGMQQINRRLPQAMIDSLIKNFNSKPEDIYLYIGSHIWKESYIYDKYPPKATDKEVWNKAIIKKGNNYHIDLMRAIKNQLKNYNLAEIRTTNIDTYTNQDYASHRASFINKNKIGQNIVGFYYK